MFRRADCGIAAEEKEEDDFVADLNSSIGYDSEELFELFKVAFDRGPNMYLDKIKAVQQEKLNIIKAEGFKCGMKNKKVDEELCSSYSSDANSSEATEFVKNKREKELIVMGLNKPFNKNAFVRAKP